MNFIQPTSDTLYSLEFCHIYTNETFSREHLRSLEKAKYYYAQLPKGKVLLNVLIDNYNSTEDLLDIQDFFTTLAEYDVVVDYYAFESDMAKYKNNLLEIIEDKKVLKNYKRYIDVKNKLPCSFMTAIWYFVRLGIFEADGIVHNLDGENFQTATELINVLPERFRAVEAQTRTLIEATPHKSVLSQIDYMFFDTLSENGNGPVF